MQVWDYILDTDDFVTTGQIRLNDDGTVDQRVHYYSGEWQEWQRAVRWTGDGNTVESVEANTGPFYELSRSNSLT
jgi:hypothetical protein